MFFVIEFYYQIVWIDIAQDMLTKENSKYISFGLFFYYERKSE
jgi:hypothetical protein